ncbi:MAG TPA: metallophosphoesterase [Anaerohalosphaeraceae bacterium]|nr:metallophosphoesterase [Anaerohalosphaeraceae bacterium]HOL30669.1 metallophosphoesterase [Anaerohalosphaeraceae bacterium]HPC63401.1 metallophosphoesterase [Anaerohalosphaeraceae bacterium]HPO70554.1 metallophosphoesterase [Anaerohalosphaeraceae bacterium]HRS71538.1 metallophosphoesterase [Anaerohalosphaeraceae bacterium]
MPFPAPLRIFKNIIGGLQKPYYCVPGNHDIGSKPTAESLQAYRKAFGRDYFAVEHKGAAFLFVNTQLWKESLEGESEKHHRWLQERLTKAFDKKLQIFVVGHYPLFIKSPHEPDEYMNLPRDKRMELLDLFERCNVAAYLGGHMHKLTMNRYKQMQLVNAEALSKNFDGRPLSFRIWYVQPPLPPRSEFIALDKNNP